MRQFVKSTFLLSSLFTLVFVVLFSSSRAMAQNPLDPICVGQAASSPVCNTPTDDPFTGDEGVLTKVTNIIALATAIVSVIVIVIAGLTITLSSGNSQSIQTARDAIIYAGVALAIAALARTIIIFIVGSIGSD
mgnify:CR=1 FL=1